MTEQRPDERVEPTREQVDEAWNRLSERVEEEPLAYSTDLITIADGLASLRARAERAEEREARLREALEDALDGLLDMRPHVFNCFARKGGYDGYIERARAALTADADEESTTP